MKTSAKGRVDGDGYRIVSAPDHPLARADGTVREHRMVLFDSIGPGEHPCHWCGWPVSWETVYRPGSDDMAERWEALISDHLDGDRLNNTIENLVAACPWCNSNRGGAARRGHQPADFTDDPPWERPLFGNVMAETHSRRKLRRLLVGATVVPPAPVVAVEELVPSPAEDKAQEALAAELYGVPFPAADPVAARRPIGVWCRWAAVGVPAAVGARWGLPAGGLGVLVWWMLVAPLVRVRRRPLPPLDPRVLRGWTSWERLLGPSPGAPVRPRPVLPAEAPEPDPDEGEGWEELPEPEDFEPAGELDDPGDDEDEEPGGVVLSGPWDRGSGGMPPPPRRRR